MNTSLHRWKYLNPAIVELDVDAERLAGTSKAVVMPDEQTIIDKPAILVDIGGRIMAWVLPAILTPARQVRCLYI